jgi:hypothetical protein
VNDSLFSTTTGISDISHAIPKANVGLHDAEDTQDIADVGSRTKLSAFLSRQLVNPVDNQKVGNELVTHSGLRMLDENPSKENVNKIFCERIVAAIDVIAVPVPDDGHCQYRATSVYLKAVNCVEGILRQRAYAEIMVD